MKAPAILIAVTSIALAAEPIKLDKFKSGTREYTNATITLEGRIMAKVTHESGVTRIPITDLPAEIRALIDPAKAPLPETPPIKELSLRSTAIDSDEFRAIFNSVHKSLNSGLLPRTVTVVQTVGSGVTLGTFGDDSFDIVMITGDFEAHADGEQFNAYLKDTNTMQEYVSVLGAKKKVRVYHRPEQMTPSTFQLALQAGGEYVVDYGKTEIQCSKCKGEPVPCEPCGSSGKLTVMQPVRVKW